MRLFRPIDTSNVSMKNTHWKPFKWWIVEKKNMPIKTQPNRRLLLFACVIYFRFCGGNLSSQPMRTNTQHTFGFFWVIRIITIKHKNSLLLKKKKNRRKINDFVVAAKDTHTKSIWFPPRDERKKKLLIKTRTIYDE